MERHHDEGNISTTFVELTLNERASIQWSRNDKNVGLTRIALVNWMQE